MINIGSVVEHKKSKRIMTVEGLKPHGSVKCAWFEGDELKRGKFTKNRVKVIKITLQGKRV